MNITDRQRAHAKRNATQDAPRYAKGRTVTPEKICTYTEYQATISGAPKTEPALTQWKEIYRDTMTAYMINAHHLGPEHEQHLYEDEEHDMHCHSCTEGIEYTDEVRVWSDAYEAIEYCQKCADTIGITYNEEEERYEMPQETPKVQVTKDGPAYLLPGIEPVGKQKGDTEQIAMF